MPLLAATTNTVTQVCIECGAERIMPVSSLQLGTVAGKDAIQLPDCACGARECLCRTWDRHPEGMGGGDHRRAVNVLAQHLRAHGQSHPAWKDHHASETAEPPDMGDLPWSAPWAPVKEPTP